MRTIEQLNEDCGSTEAAISVFRAGIQPIHEAIAGVNPVYAYFYPETAKIIAGVKTRSQFAPIRALYKDKWQKSVDAESATYIARISGIEVYIHVSELPPSCKIVEEEIDVPAHKEIKRRVVCNGGPVETPAAV